MAWERPINTTLYCELTMLSVQVTPNRSITTTLGIWYNQASYANGDDPLFSIAGSLEGSDIPNINTSLATIRNKIIAELAIKHPNTWGSLQET